EEVPVQRRETLLDDVGEDQDQRHQRERDRSPAKEHHDPRQGFPARRPVHAASGVTGSTGAAVLVFGALTLTSRLTLQISRREAALMITVSTKRTRPISISADR